MPALPERNLYCAGCGLTTTHVLADGLWVCLTDCSRVEAVDTLAGIIEAG